MRLDFLDDLLSALDRLVPLDPEPLKEILILSGMPEETENLRYLAYNRQMIPQVDRNLEFSAMAVINNRRIARWRMQGFRRTLSRIVFHPLWTRRNPMDLFLNTLRNDSRMMDLMAASRRDYTLFGILQIERIKTARTEYLTQPVVALPRLEGPDLATVSDFEKANQFRR